MNREMRFAAALLLALATTLPVWAQTKPRLTITKFSDLNPPNAEAPLAVTVRIENGSEPGEYELECEVLDYWFRPSIIRQPLQLAKNEVKDIEISLDDETRKRLFKARHEAGSNLFQVNAVLKAGERIAARAPKRSYTFERLVRKPRKLPALPEQYEVIDDVFGKGRLVDEIRCYDPSDPHPYMEGGRGLGCKYTGAVPQMAWKDMYREKNPHFATVENVLDEKCRVAHGWGWFGYKFNREGLTPGKAYVLVMEYPEDTGRTYNTWNTGMSCSYFGGYGFHTGKTLGDHWTRTLNSEYVDYPLSGKYRKWYSFFYLHEKSWRPGLPRTVSFNHGDSRDGFWFVVGSVGPSMDALSSGAAVRTLKLYELEDVPSLFPKVNEPPLELGRREIFLTAESGGRIKFDSEEYDLWAKERLCHAKFLGMTGLAPNHWGTEDTLLKANAQLRLGLKILPRLMMQYDIFEKIGLPDEAMAKDIHGEYAHGYRVERLPDIVHPASLRAMTSLIGNNLRANLHYPSLHGVMFFKHYSAPLTISFSDYALKLFEQETGAKINGASGQPRRDWLMANRKAEYYNWWYGKKREFLLAIRDCLQALRPDLKLFYYPWHSDDDFPFSCGRLRYSGHPLEDKIYVPGTNILLVPSFTVPMEKWTAAQKKRPGLARGYYREKIAPELAGKITLQDILYGRHKGMKEFWGAPRSGELPHLLYPHEMDLIRMFTEPGSIYTPHGIGSNPQLFRNDQGIVYWAPVHYRFTADNPEFLDLFKTGEGAAMANNFPYNEETSGFNCQGLMGATGVEHGGPFCMMEEVLAMAHADPNHLMMGMWEPLKRGFPKYAREFAAAYRALPVGPSQTLEGAVKPKDNDIVVRCYKTDYGTYLAVINRAFDLNPRSIALTLDPETGPVHVVENLVTGKTLPFKQSGLNKIEFAVSLRPMELKSLRIVPRTPRTAFRDVQITRKSFSPNNDGENDELVVTGRTIADASGRDWTGAVYNALDHSVRTFRGKKGIVQWRWDGLDDAGKLAPDGAYTIMLQAEGFPKAPYRVSDILLSNTPPTSPSIAAGTPQVVRYNAMDLSGIAETEKVRIRVNKHVIEAIVSADGAYHVSLGNLALGENAITVEAVSAGGVPSRPTVVSVEFKPAWLQPEKDTLFFVDYTRSLDASVAKGDPVATALGNVVQSADGVKIEEGGALNYATKGNMILLTGIMEMWFKPSWKGSDESTAILFSEYAGEDQNMHAIRCFKHTTGDFYAGCMGSGGWAQSTAIKTSVLDWEANAWHHVKLAWTADALGLALDGGEMTWRPVSAKGRPRQLEPQFWVGSWKQWNLPDAWQKGSSRCLIRQVRINAPGATERAAKTAKMMQLEKTANLMSNPSFENAQDGKAPGWGFQQWAPKGVKPTARGALDSNVAHTGKASLRIEATGDKQFGQWQNIYGKLFAPVPVKGGRKYLVVWYVKTDIPPESKKNELIFTANFMDAERKRLTADEASQWYSRVPISTSSDWCRVTAEISAPEEAVVMYMAMALQGKGTAWFDDLAVIPLGDGTAGINEAGP